MTVYAVRTTRHPKPEYAAAGCPFTGWIHESDPPWRVLAAEDPQLLASFAKLDGIVGVMEYAGAEETVDVLDKWPPPPPPTGT